MVRLPNGFLYASLVVIIDKDTLNIDEDLMPTKMHRSPVHVLRFSQFLAGTIFTSVVSTVCLAQTTSHLFSSPKSPKECIEAVKQDSLELMIPATYGLVCVQEFHREIRLCSDGGEAITSHRLDVIGSVNLQRQPSVTETSADCVSAAITSRTADHRGSYPGYFCSPARLQAVLTISYCAVMPPTPE